MRAATLPKVKNNFTTSEQEKHLHTMIRMMIISDKTNTQNSYIVNAQAKGDNSYTINAQANDDDSYTVSAQTKGDKYYYFTAYIVNYEYALLSRKSGYVSGIP